MLCVRCSVPPPTLSLSLSLPFATCYLRKRRRTQAEGTTWLIGASTSGVFLDVDFRSRKGCVNPSLLFFCLPPHTPLPFHHSSHPPPFSRVARLVMALLIGADPLRGVEADFGLLGSARPSSAVSIRPSAGHPPPRSRQSRSLKSRTCVCTLRFVFASFSSL